MRVKSNVPNLTNPHVLTSIFDVSASFHVVEKDPSDYLRQALDFRERPPIDLSRYQSRNYFGHSKFDEAS